MKLKYKKGSCAKKGIGLLGTYIEDNETYNFFVPIKTRGAGENALIEYQMNYFKKYPTEKKLKTRYLNGKEKDEFLKEFPSLKNESNILVTEFDTTSDDFIKNMLTQNQTLSFLNCIYYIDFDRKCYDDKSLIEIINEERIENGKNSIGKEDYIELIEWLKSKEFSDIELSIFNDEIKKVEKGERTLAEIQYNAIEKNG